jgi:hypothetical protein
MGYDARRFNLFVGFWMKVFGLAGLMLAGSGVN